VAFSVVLGKIIGERYLLYRVADGFARGGVLVFDIERKQEGLCLLTIYVAFDFPRGRDVVERMGWRLFDCCSRRSCMMCCGTMHFAS